MKAISIQRSAFSIDKNKGIMMLMVLAVFCMFVINDAEAVQINDILKAFVKENYPWAEVDITDVIVAGEDRDGQPERILVQNGIPGRTVFVVEYKDGRRIVVTATVKAFDWAVMARRSFKKGYVLQKDDVYTALMESSRIPKDAIQVSDQVVGAVINRSVMGNSPVSAGMIQESQQIKRGRRVMIVAESEGFSIHVKGELKENGRIGHDVKVVNLDSKKIIVGRLINENMVKVVF